MKRNDPAERVDCYRRQTAESPTSASVLDTTPAAPVAASHTIKLFLRKNFFSVLKTGHSVQCPSYPCFCIDTFRISEPCWIWAFNLVFCFVRPLLFRLGVTLKGGMQFSRARIALWAAQGLHAVGQELAGCAVIYELGVCGVSWEPSKDLTAVRLCEKPARCYPPRIFAMFALQSGSLTLFCTLNPGFFLQICSKQATWQNLFV